MNITLADKEKAKKYYLDNDGEVSIKTLARRGGTTCKQAGEWVKEWKHLVEDDEDFDLDGTEYGLTPQEEEFCFHYMKTYNSTMSAVKAGYEPARAHTRGWALLKRPEVQGFLNEIRSRRNEELYIDGIDIMREYMKIAFADINDFVEFGSKKTRVFNEDGEFSDVDRSFVKLKDSSSVDGSVLQEVKVGRDGVAIKLLDKMKALDTLKKYVSGEDKLKLQLLEAQISKLGEEESTEEMLAKYFDALGAKIDGTD